MKKNRLYIFQTLVFFSLLCNSCEPDPADPCRNQFSISKVVVNNVYQGQKNGLVVAQITGDTSGTVFQINDGPVRLANIFDSLSAGTYQIKARNARGCVSTREVTLLEVPACSDIKVSMDIDSIRDPIGTVRGYFKVTANGGRGFRYDMVGPAAASNTTGIFSNLAGGTYIVTATNSSGCKSLPLSLTLTQRSACDSRVPVTVTTSVTPAIPCESRGNGAIRVTALKGSDTSFTYRIGKSDYGSSRVFSNLKEGRYDITVRHSTGCVITTSVTVPRAAPGKLFSTVRNILLKNCQPCHTIRSDGNTNFLDTCQILSKWSRILARVENNTMPPPVKGEKSGKGLSAEDKSLLRRWVSGGHRYNE